MMRRLERTSIFDIMTYPAGKSVETIQRELGYEGEIIRMVSNENPLGTSPRALEAIRKCMKDVNLYPDDSCYDLRVKLAALHGVSPDCISVGSGSTEIIRSIAMAFLNQGETVVMSKPCFIMARLATKVMASEPIEVPLDNYHHDLKGILNAIRSDTKIIYLDNPSNPIGTMIHTAQMDNLLQDIPPDILVVLDEAYRDYIDREDFPDSVRYVSENRNVVVLRSFSKVYGLAGLRIGYSIGTKSLIRAIEQTRPPFNVNRMAQSAAMAALDDSEFVSMTKENNDRGLLFLTTELHRLGITFIPSVANFLSIDLGSRVNEIVEDLQHHGIIVRPLAAYDLPTFVRVTVGTEAQNRRFVELLEGFLAANGQQGRYGY
jgi:histidinol-phosphate aminotransferase